MKAIVRTRYGPPDVLQFTDAEKPSPKHDEVLIKIHAASVNPLDWRFLRGQPFLIRLGGLLKPKHKILGVDERCGHQRLSQNRGSLQMTKMRRTGFRNGGKCFRIRGVSLVGV
jgi:D-arabinose 1-dehydrogenase-like Zn-dependent alcohol dehydrogenase